MGDFMPKRLRQPDITIRQLLELSYSVYGKEVDDKKARAVLDVTDAKITYRNNLEEKKGEWTQTGRNVKIVFRCKSVPFSYKKSDNVSPHIFPVTFLIRNIDEGVDSAFKYRSGSNFKWKTTGQKISEGRNTAEKDRIRKKNKSVSESNIKNGIDAHFVFHLMNVLKHKRLLYGPDTTNGKLPKVTNKNLLFYFEKHSLYCLENFVIPMLNKPDKFFTDLR